MAIANNRPDVLLAKYLTKTLTEAEKEIFDVWVNSNPRHKLLVEELEKDNVFGQQLKNVSAITSVIVEEDRKLLAAKLLGEVEPTSAIVKPIYSYAIWRRVAVAVGIIVLLFAAYRQFFQPAAFPETIANNNPVTPKPGTDKAVLILADGRKIILDSVVEKTLNLGGNIATVDPGKGILTYQDLKNKVDPIVEQNTLETPNGGQYKVQLSDGTTVWLNAASSITYPSLFAGTTREVSITGEVYMEVAKNKKIPFVVHVGKEQTIEVLGTKFAINAYQDEPLVKTTLVEGSVKVTTALVNDPYVKLRPGQQSQVSHENLRVVNANVEEATAFINGLFFFDNADMVSVLRQVEKWYDIKVHYRGAINTEKFQGKIYRSSSLPETLKILGRYGVDFEVKGNQVYVQQTK